MSNKIQNVLLNLFFMTYHVIHIYYNDNVKKFDE